MVGLEAGKKGVVTNNKYLFSTGLLFVTDPFNHLIGV